MIDSHCHLNFETLSKDLPNIVKRCIDNGVTHLLSINTNPKDFQTHLDLISDFNNISKNLLENSKSLIFNNSNSIIKKNGSVEIIIDQVNIYIKDDLNNPSNTSLASFCSFKVKEFCQVSISSINSTLPSS